MKENGRNFGLVFGEPAEDLGAGDEPRAVVADARAAQVRAGEMGKEFGGG